jgi:hypothetical protein
LRPFSGGVELRVQLWSVNQRATEAEEPPPIKFVTGKHSREIAIVESCYQVKTSKKNLRRHSVE